MQQNNKRPNIIFYFSDQQRWDTIGCYGQRLNVTPTLDALAARGTLFEYAFTCQPVCGPARASLQTGLYAAEVGAHTNDRILPEGIDTLARRLDAGGYETAYIGKWHLASCKESSYQTKPVPPERRGGYHYWMASDVLEYTSHGYNGYVYDADMQRHDFVGHRIDCINAYAVDFLHNYVKEQTDKPFFLFVSHIDPHHQNDNKRFEGPDGSKRRFRNFDIPGDLAGKEGNWQENYPDYLGQCNLIDQNVGKLMDTLEETGLADNTVFIYSSDHGCLFRTRHNDYKRSCEDGCLRIPLIACGGPFENIGKKSEMVSLIDVPSTILDLAGIDIPQHYRGNSLVSLVKNEAKDWPDAVYAQISESENGRTVRTKEWKYCVCAPNFVYDEAYPAQYVEEKLYDLRNDPYENNNLIHDPAYTSVRNQMLERLKGFMRHAHEPDADIICIENQA